MSKSINMSTINVPTINLTRDPHIWDAPQMCHRSIGDIIVARDPSTKFDEVQSITFGQQANEIFSEVNLINHIREMFNFTIEDFDINFDH